MRWGNHNTGNVVNLTNHIGVCATIVLLRFDMRDFRNVERWLNAERSRKVDIEVSSPGFTEVHEIFPAYHYLSLKKNVLLRCCKCTCLNRRLDVECL